MMFNGFFSLFLTGMILSIEGVRGAARPYGNVYGSSSAISAAAVGGYPQTAESLGVVLGGRGGGTGTLVIATAGTGSTGGYGGRHHGGVVIGSGGHGQQGSDCRYWCRTPSKKYYCCESSNQHPGHANGHPGKCPPVRPFCAPTRAFASPPKACSYDENCAYSDKCCFDQCLKHRVCKPAEKW